MPMVKLGSACRAGIWQVLTETSFDAISVTMDARMASGNRSLALTTSSSPESRRDKALS
jgi:hypothetical protein